MVQWLGMYSRISLQTYKHFSQGAMRRACPSPHRRPNCSCLRLYLLARVGMDGIKADLSKLTAVINWQTPSTIQNLGSFLGLTGYFWPLIKNYSLLEKPLKDLLNTLGVSKASRKCVYQDAAQAHKLKNQWSWEHDKDFVILKTVLTSFLVLKGPKYDGSSFVITTDGCKDGFVGILSQCFKWINSRQKPQTHVHPIMIALKCTSKAESLYKPYLLKFAALKFSLNKFSDTISGYPVEIETDCQAHWDAIINNNLYNLYLMAWWNNGP